VTVGEGCERIHLFDNTVGGSALTSENVEDRASAVQMSEPETPPAAGPQAAQTDSARHLGLLLPAGWEGPPQHLTDTDVGT
jgi:hypothetical protein